ncbi:unnamed protein product [Hermetia illucens]|uniref:MD-2-related lipid-recognition domain-containing protein n=1 Tax=Hermetia illucens TaxID=343691 RepID=A0A7R8UBU9_HERIL|nr:uncharacterized protein LOC119651368 [Hermetia illucens]CAD7077897.1 unnamed protein product [Hermetia illucens]
MRSWIILGCLIQIVLSAERKNLNSIKITNVECIPNDEWFNDTKCILKPLKNRSILIQGRTFAKKPVKTLKVHIEIHRWYSGFRPYLVNFWSDFCDIISKPEKMNALMKPFYNLITTYSNLRGPCPIEGLIEISPAVPELPVIPSLLVTGTYRCVLTFVEKDLDQWIYTFRVKAEVTSALRE